MNARHICRGLAGGSPLAHQSSRRETAPAPPPPAADIQTRSAGPQQQFFGDQFQLSLLRLVT